MIRKQLCITEDLERRLERIAAARGTSQSEVVRDALAAYADAADAASVAAVDAMRDYLELVDATRSQLPADWAALSRGAAHERAGLR